MDKTLIFILVLIFFFVLGIWYIFSELNITNSSYMIRNKKQKKERFNNSYYEWFVLNEKKLLCLYEEEKCEDMDLPFDQFCLFLFKGGTINYY